MKKRIALLIPLLTAAFVLAQSSSPAVIKADRVIVKKKDRMLILMSKGKELKTYRISLGGDPVGPKSEQGDHKTPEGTYILDSRNAYSQFHRSLHISYPNTDDRTRARKRGVSPGGNVCVHGLPNGYGWVGRDHVLKDWTDGCIAVTDAEIEEIWKLVPDGTPIEIRP